MRLLVVGGSDAGISAALEASSLVLRQGNDLVPIPGTKRVPYLEEIVGALDVELNADDLARIEEAFPTGAAAGEQRTPRAGAPLFIG